MGGLCWLLMIYTGGHICFVKLKYSECSIVRQSCEIGAFLLTPNQFFNFTRQTTTLLNAQPVSVGAEMHPLTPELHCWWRLLRTAAALRSRETLIWYPRYPACSSWSERVTFHSQPHRCPASLAESSPQARM